MDAADLGSFTDAAMKNHMTVPAISQSIKQLEEELGTTIFHRSRKGIVPTTEGLIVIKHAASILKAVNQMKQEISLSQEEALGNIVIATIPGMVSQVIHTTIELTKIYPLMNVQLIEGDTKTVLAQVMEGHAMMGFVSSFSHENQEESLEWEPVMRGKAVIIVNKNSAMRFQNNISPDDINNEVFVLYKDEFIEFIAAELIAANPTNRIALSSNNVEALIQMVLEGNAITIGPDFILQSLPAHYREHIVSIPITKYKTMPNILWRITRKGDKITNIAEQFTNRLLAYNVDTKC